MSGLDRTNDPALKSWVQGAGRAATSRSRTCRSAFFRSTSDRRRAGVAIGDYILDLAAIADAAR